jgi:cholesterol transport system auxiliary component
MLLVGAVVSSLLAGCSVGPQPREAVATYDFGIAPAAPAGDALPPSLIAGEVTAPAWLDTPALVYRLAYRDAAQPLPYASSRWVAPPAQLLAQRMRSELAARQPQSGPAAGKGELVLAVELAHFSHVFDSPTASRALVQAHATVSAAGRRSVVGRRTFVIEVPAASHDAHGGAHALAAAGRQLVEQTLAWGAQQARLR